MVEVEADLRLLPAEFLSILNGTLCHVAEQSLVGVVACALRNLQNYR